MIIFSSGFERAVRRGKKKCIRKETLVTIQPSERERI